MITAQVESAAPYSLGMPNASSYSPSVRIFRASSAHSHCQSPQMPAGASTPYSFSGHLGSTLTSSSIDSLGIVTTSLAKYAPGVRQGTTSPRRVAGAAADPSPAAQGGLTPEAASPRHTPPPTWPNLWRGRGLPRDPDHSTLRRAITS